MTPDEKTIPSMKGCVEGRDYFWQMEEITEYFTKFGYAYNSVGINDETMTKNSNQEGIHPHGHINKRRNICAPGATIPNCVNALNMLDKLWEDPVAANGVFDKSDCFLRQKVRCFVQQISSSSFSFSSGQSFPSSTLQEHAPISVDAVITATLLNLRTDLEKYHKHLLNEVSSLKKMALTSKVVAQVTSANHKKLLNLCQNWLRYLFMIYHTNPFIILEIDISNTILNLMNLYF
jgi:hypothetical protein